MSRSFRLLLTSSWLAGLVAVSVAGSNCTPLESGRDEFGPSSTGATSGSSVVGGTSSSGAPSGGGNGGNASSGQAGAPDPTAGQGGEGNPSTGCPALADRKEERLPEAAGTDVELTGAVHWSCHSRYVLQGNVLVADGATLTIDPGVTVLAAPASLLLVERGGKLLAEGTAAEPIVFTSSRNVGKRAPGDFRGVVLIGDGPSHTASEPVYNLPFSDRRAQYGGGPAGKVNGSCGSLRYVRVEFAGGNLGDADQPGAALTFAGCGSGTVVDYVQVHRGADGVGIFGGTVPLRHVVISRNKTGTALKWTRGYTGTIQYLIAQSLGASAAFLGSNEDGAEKAAPVSRPQIYNATLVGTAPSLVTGEHFGVLLQFGSGLVLKNSIVQGFADAAFSFGTPPNAADVGPGQLVDITNIQTFNNVSTFTASAQLLATKSTGLRDKNPQLPDAASATAPSFVPGDTQVNIDVATAPPPFDATGSFRGAVAPDGVDWTATWTAYPEN